MTYGTREDGSGYLELTPEENAAFKAGKPVVKRSGDNNGIFRIQAQIVRPNRLADRFPESEYGPNYKPSTQSARLVDGQLVGVPRP